MCKCKSRSLQDVAKQIIGEASAKLSRALQKNDLTDAKVAQVMLSAGNTKWQETSAADKKS